MQNLNHQGIPLTYFFDTAEFVHKIIFSHTHKFDQILPISAVLVYQVPLKD